MSVVCPVCEMTANVTDTQYGVRNSCCGLWSWGNGDLVDAETHDARKSAHAAFDPLWKQHGMSRGEAYAKLAKEMAIDPTLCHMKTMDKVELYCVPGAVYRIALRQEKFGVVA